MAKIMQTEDNTKQACLFLLLRCGLTYSKLVKIVEKYKKSAAPLWSCAFIIIM